MIKEAIVKIAEGKNLTQPEMTLAFEEIMSGVAEPCQIAAFITALRIKGETVEEITAAAKVMRKFAVKIDAKDTGKEHVVDTCGTGGSRVNTFNISTAAAFVVAGCDIKVAKHGNRAASGHCGSADVLERLGVNINLTPAQVAECIKTTGMGFLFAPLFHSAMKYAAGVRKAIGIRTIFNILGPLSNPANATCQVLGVYNRSLTKAMAQVLNNLGVKHAFVVCGYDGTDEVSITGPTQISELKDNKVKTYTVTVQQYGFKKARMEDIAGGDSEYNAKVLLSVLEGEKGPKRDVVLLNSAFAIYTADGAKTVKDAIKKAKSSIDSGSALKKLKELKEFSNKKG